MQAPAVPATGLLPRAIVAQTRAEILLTLRRGENLLITIIVPVLLLIFFAALGVPGLTTGRPVDFLLPGVLGLAIIATGMVNLGIATAYERYYGVLKRLGASPLSRGGLLIAKALSILVLEIVQVALLLLVAIGFYGWRPTGSPLLLGLVIVVGTLAFAGLGLAMAGSLRAEATLAAANGLYILFLGLSGAILPLDRLPDLIRPLARLLPGAALIESLRAALSGAAFPAGPLTILALWAAGTILFAARTFQWE